ncbi:MAG: GntR family transcriptional regulator [Deltaproteobacteria bacterium]|nr:GntR family transcriptional regulator [Deltaproteobacteria bacterium]
MKKLVIQDNSTIRKKVYTYVREQILSGQIAPNERLIETKIAQEIGTSRTPVREALHNLEIEGLIRSIPRVGYQVKAISESEVEETCAIRSVIECLAAQWAMERASAKIIRELKKNIAATAERVSRGEVRAFIDLDAQFHEIIARGSGSTRLLELSQTLRGHMLRYRVQSIFSEDAVLTALKGHEGILKAIEKKDPQKVTEAIQVHLEESKKNILRYAIKK